MLVVELLYYEVIVMRGAIGISLIFLFEIADFWWWKIVGGVKCLGKILVLFRS
jgi:hypothetical protein